MRAVCTMRACSVHSACVQREQCVRAACIVRTCSAHNACVQFAECVRAACTMCACSPQCVRAVCTMRACSPHSACVQGAQCMRACSLHNACVQRAQCLRAVCTMGACTVHSACGMGAARGANYCTQCTRRLLGPLPFSLSLHQSQRGVSSPFQTGAPLTHCAGCGTAQLQSASNLQTHYQTASIPSPPPLNLLHAPSLVTRCVLEKEEEECEICLCRCSCRNRGAETKFSAFFLDTRGSDPNTFAPNQFVAQT